MNPKAIFLLGIFMVLFSCKESDNDEAPIKPAVPKIKTITHHNGSRINTENYEYDHLGRVSKVTFSEGNYDYYDYRTDTIFRNCYFNDEWPLSIDTLLLNEAGWVVNEFFGTNAREYTLEGNLVKSIFYNFYGEPALLIANTVSDGNTTVSEIWESDKGPLELTHTYEYEYFTDRINTIGHENTGMPFYGKQDKNLVSASNHVTHLPDNQREVAYTYELDSQNRVVKKKEVGSPDNVYETYTYYD